MRRDNRSRVLPARFWVEAVVAALGAVLFVVTVFTREWIELLSGFDPDGGNGAAEFALAIGLLGAAAVSALSARRTFRIATA
jgi:hypothetical protein